ncbi:hypothetical protein HDU87_002651 [Geranomyces variabilis]|uniref:AAA+ ATPase domain-containing protein n=1 Tax=Geranomyces variabilis TaxID=109894 RepID=A0AAD5TRZ6_9FUNG|nr:hypothetical protein HDU87_002651 [Geranomyces variabilis]
MSPSDIARMNTPEQNVRFIETLPRNLGIPTSSEKLGKGLYASSLQVSDSTAVCDPKSFTTAASQTTSDAAKNTARTGNTADKISLPFIETFVRPVSAPTLTGPPADIHAGRYGLFGTFAGSTITANIARGSKPQHVYLNTADPFCLVAVGVQGAGKSHTLATVMEASLYTAPPVTRAEPPMLGLVFHYSEHGADAGVCEAATLALDGGGNTSDNNAAVIKRKPVTIIVSPSFYAQRKQVYTDILGPENCRVVPMLFRWHELTAAQIRGLLRVSVDGEMPLYMSVILDMLRKHQKRSHGRGMPSYKDFKAEITTLGLSHTQMEALMQRLRLIEMFLAEADENAGLGYHPLPELFDISALVIADLTDPLLSGAEANGLFEVLFSRFLRMDTPRGKLVVCDEAHKYLSGSSSTTALASCSDPLTASLVSATQQMRHHGLRVVVSTQSPRVLPSALLEVVSVAVIHAFHARDWFKHLQRKLPLADVWYAAIQRLGLGEAAVFSRKWDTSALGDTGNVRTVQVRPRISGDGGAGKILKD